MHLREKQVAEQQHQLQLQQQLNRLQQQLEAQMWLTTSNSFATLPVADEQEQQLPSQPAK
ncbi:hypothetical protein HaLaN_29558 [Haematococcus lacustris]|uniref:Uncharacterized protein n=1 Tax=Haematococcus lacustris TaxID=44745 RepID=A0A6A0ADD0_HAELA|nr:hypothetical protein HaLaN_29558 [Haematococcus lacustris]